MCKLRLLLLVLLVPGAAVAPNGDAQRPPAATPGTCAEALAPFCADPAWPEARRDMRYQWRL